MKLADWLASNGKNDEWLAGQIGRERSFVSKLRTGKKHPSFATAHAIQVATNGAVTPNDFMAPPLPASTPDPDKRPLVEERAG